MTSFKSRVKVNNGQCIKNKAPTDTGMTAYDSEMEGNRQKKGNLPAGSYGI